MKEKDNKLRLVKQILVDDNGIKPASIASKDRATAASNSTESNAKTPDLRSRKVSCSLLCLC